MQQIKFNKRIYNKEAIKLGVEQYRDFVSLDVSEDISSIDVLVKDIKDKEIGFDIIKNEFCNFVLFKTIEMLG